ncbi:hypothetical protein [Psychromonas sp. SP041]|uniref:hypothetical protein n=1 Tax=Psychromonas sp. SP041 TaxID=1365007 RepID=UPI0010C786F4|nr:hypothetical protein [Psychromonas sp. SP041]
MKDWTPSEQDLFVSHIKSNGGDASATDLNLCSLFKVNSIYFEINLDSFAIDEELVIYGKFVKEDEEDGAFFFSAEEVGTNLPYCAARTLSSSLCDIEEIRDIINSKARIVISWLEQIKSEKINLSGFDKEAGTLDNESIFGVVRMGDRHYVDSSEVPCRV